MRKNKWMLPLCKQFQTQISILKKHYVKHWINVFNNTHHQAMMSHHLKNLDHHWLLSHPSQKPIKPPQLCNKHHSQTSMLSHFIIWGITKSRLHGMGTRTVYIFTKFFDDKLTFGSFTASSYSNLETNLDPILFC